MRCSSIVFHKSFPLFGRPKLTLAEKLLERLNVFEKASISYHTRPFHYVPVYIDYHDVGDLIPDDRTAEKLCLDHDRRNADLDIAMACKRFPSISLGYSPPVVLYDGKPYRLLESGLLVDHIHEEFLPNSIDCLYEAWAPLCPGKPEHKLLPLPEESVTFPMLPMSSLEKERKVLESSKRINTSEDHILHNSISPTELPEDTFASGHWILDSRISCIPSMTKKRLNQLEDYGFHTVRKLLCHYPRTYVDLQNAQVKIVDGQYLIFVGKVSLSRAIRASSALSFLEVLVACDVAEDNSTSECALDEAEKRSTRTIYLHLKRFFSGARFTFQNFLRSVSEKYKEGEIVCVSGKVRCTSKTDHYEMREYSLDTLQDEGDASISQKEMLYPIYPSKGGLKPKFLSDVITRCLQLLPANMDPIPETIRKEFGLVSLHKAYTGIHKPKDLTEADLSRRRLIFDEFFYLQLGRLYQMLESLGTKLERESLLDRYSNPEITGVPVEDWAGLTKEFLKTLPYSLTSSQLRAVSEIVWDLRRPVPMNRLLQGDVGCGKTVVAFLACMEVIGSGHQAAFMVPTELLAVQHYEHLNSLLANFKDGHQRPFIALLTGSTTSRQSNMIQEGLKSGDISMVIGSHSLIAEKIEFSSLRIAVIDEQQRFGVIQRGRFNSKLYYNSSSSKLVATDSSESLKDSSVMAPHVLAMSATPIPRTLALALYGDMSLKQITELPPGRIPVETLVIEGNETGFEKVYEVMQEELQDGGRVYVVYPVIEQCEQLPQLRAASAEFDSMSTRFSGYCCGLLHGRMKSNEKEEALRQFRNGETNILLSTQVIEIGVDVPEASMMVVVNAERFGVAQLHQLRGRVGRGGKKSKCILVSSTASSMNRLKVMEKSKDGFHLANMDLINRGPGDLLGKKQSGHLPEFPIARLGIDGSILQEAHLAALKVLCDSHDLEQYPGLKSELSMRQPLCLLGD